MSPSPLPSSRPRAAGWAPRILVIADSVHARKLFARACLHFEPHAEILAAEHPAEVPPLMLSEPPDLLLMESDGDRPDRLEPLLQWVQCVVRPPLVALVGNQPVPWPATGPGPSADARPVCMGWTTLPPWLAVTLPRLRCRAELAALRPGAFGDTTRPGHLVTTV
ncbi:hypothetical protein EV676_107246 [Caldimonas thermodepolymerans]|uniref:Uncharacterized protein n=1 Tax=Caldimonas thermodepolymerans TaxID=215580 RepID=A0AA46DCC0_9BURK|nr:hypothetical protein EV676_107246 [Caldimonas thermodepolymerans]